MKFSLSVLLAIAGALAAQAELTIVSGNVYDVGKYSQSKDPELWLGDIYVGPFDDSAMCWAASAANIIQHWQDTYSDFADPEKTVPNGTQVNEYIYPRGTGELVVYQQILQDWKLSSGVPYNPITWWMKGPSMDGSPGWCYYPSGSLKLNYSSVPAVPAPAAYYKKLFGSAMPKYATGLQNAPFYSLQIDKFGTASTSPKLADIRTTLLEAFEVQGQAVSLLVQGVGSDNGHAISCWGYETDENGVITSLILTDSDDRMFGTFIVNLSEAADGTATIQTDRYNSWYHGDYVIKDVVYITTPEKTSVQIGDKPAGTAVAKSREVQAEIEDLDNPVTQSGRLTKAVSTGTHVTIGDGTFYQEEVVDQTVLFTTTKDASISIADSDYFSDGALLTVEDGGMALLYGGLSLQGGGSDKNDVRGAEVLGHLYIHGGDVTIENCSTYDRGGAAMQGGVLPPSDSVVTNGVFATSYIEVRHAGSVSIHDNASEVSSATFVGGGAISAEDSFSFRDNKSVVINGNSIEGYFVYGGGAFAHMEATLSGNTELEMRGNNVLASSCIAEGGALAAMFTNICDNESVTFAGNLAQADDCGDYMYQDPATSVLIRGAHASGGAVAVSFPSAIADTSGDYIPAELHMDGNGSISFSANTAEAILSDHPDNDAYASGGGLYVGNLLRQTGEPVGAVASISGNTAGVVFDGNQALADSYRLQKWGGDANGVARGGAAYVAQNACLSIDSNKGGVTFSNNVAEGSEIAQGGGIYNAGKLQITHNDAVEFSNNTADEGSHIFNDEGGVAEIAWNGKVLFSGASAEDSTVVNKGKMFLAAEQGKEIQFHNTVLDTTQGTLTVGSDASGNVGNTALAFTEGGSSFASEARTVVSSIKGLPAVMKGLSLSAGIIVAGEGQNVYLNNVAVATNTDLVVKDMTLGTGVQLAETTAGRTLTLSNVDIDLSGASLTSTANDQGGKDYVFNLRGMLSGSVTMLNVTFDAEALLGQDIDFINKDRVCMMFGDVTYFPDESDGITIAMVGPGGVIETYAHTAIDGGNVYFGGYFEVPEPTTGTLGLLALAALAARRRKG